MGDIEILPPCSLVFEAPVSEPIAMQNSDPLLTRGELEGSTEFLHNFDSTHTMVAIDDARIWASTSMRKPTELRQELQGIPKNPSKEIREKALRK